MPYASGVRWEGTLSETGSWRNSAGPRGLREYDGVSLTLTVTVERIRVEGLLELIEDDPERAFVLELGAESAMADRLALSDPDRRVGLDTGTCRAEEWSEEIIGSG